MREVQASELGRAHPGMAQVGLEYVAHRMKNPERGSIFAKQTWWVRLLPSRLLLSLLTSRLFRYDGFLFFDGERDEVLGHVFFQRHGRAIHMFSVFVVPAYQNQGIAQVMLRHLLQHAWLNKIYTVRLGGDGSEKMKRLRERFLKYTNLPFEASLQNGSWVWLAPKIGGVELSTSEVAERIAQDFPTEANPQLALGPK